MSRLDLWQAAVLIAAVGLLALAYGLRVLLRGRPSYERVERQGGSPLLGKALMEMAYWGLQPVARFAVFLGLSPNQLSALSVVFAILSGACLVFGHFGFAAFCATSASLLDALDGMIARIYSAQTGVHSRVGELLDSTLDRYVEFFFLAGAVIYYRPIPIVMGLALFAILGSFMVSYSTAKAEAMGVKPPSNSLMRRPERALYLTAGAALCPVTIPIFEVYRLYPIAIGHPMVFALGLVALLSNISAVERTVAIARSIREREADARLKVAAPPLEPSEHTERSWCTRGR